MITLSEFYMGRDKAFASELTEEIRTNAAETVRRINAFLDLFYTHNPKAYKRTVNSGWRPPAVNARTKKAAKKSKHMMCLACDLSDDDELLDKWCMSANGRKAMETIGLWLEHPSATPRWCHLQTVPPNSGNRVFYP